MDSNFATMTGRLVKEADIYETNSERVGKVLHFTIAVQRPGMKNPKTGKYPYTQADFIPCLLFDGSAEMFYAQQVNGFIKKGTKLSLIGRLTSFPKPIDSANPKAGRYTEVSLKVIEFHVILSDKYFTGEKSGETDGEKSGEDMPDYPNDGSGNGFDL